MIYMITQNTVSRYNRIDYWCLFVSMIPKYIVRHAAHRDCWWLWFVIVLVPIVFDLKGIVLQKKKKENVLIIYSTSVGFKAL